MGDEVMATKLINRARDALKQEKTVSVALAGVSGWIEITAFKVMDQNKDAGQDNASIIRLVTAAGDIFAPLASIVAVQANDRKPLRTRTPL